MALPSPVSFDVTVTFNQRYNVSKQHDLLKSMKNIEYIKFYDHTQYEFIASDYLYMLYNNNDQYKTIILFESHMTITRCHHHTDVTAIAALFNVDINNTKVDLLRYHYPLPEEIQPCDKMVFLSYNMTSYQVLDRNVKQISPNEAEAHDA